MTWSSRGVLAEEAHYLEGGEEPERVLHVSPDGHVVDDDLTHPLLLVDYEQPWRREQNEIWRFFSLRV